MLETCKINNGILVIYYFILRYQIILTIQISYQTLSQRIGNIGVKSFHLLIRLIN